MKKSVKEALAKHKHFGYQYIVAIVVIGALLFASMGALLINTVSLHRQLQSNMERYADDLTSQLASEISSKMEMRSDHIANLAETLSSMEMADIEEERLIHSARHMNMEDVFVIGGDGTIFGASDKHMELATYVANNIAFYREPRMFFTESDEIFYSAAINWEGQEPGVLIGVRDKAILQNMLDKVAARCGGLCCMVDSNGAMVVTPSDSTPFLKLDDLFNKAEKGADAEEAERVLQNVRNGISGVAVFETIGDEPLMLGYDFLGINDWMLLSVVPMAQFSTGIDAHLMKYMAILCVMGIVMVIIILYLIGVYQRSLKRIKAIALTDVLTDGLNNQGFRIDCERILKDYPSRNFAMVYLNIRNFKRFNERFGVRVSDEILIKIYEILKANMTSSELLARTVGDHYYLLLMCDSEEAVRKRLRVMTDCIVAALSEIYLIDEERIAFGAYMIANRDADVLVMQTWAKVASAYSKEHDVVCFYDEAIEARLQWEQQIEEDFRRAIKEREFKLYIQPKVARDTLVANSGEVLVRWMHPVHGMIMPGRFISLLERNGKICDLDFYIFEETCKLLRDELKKGTAMPLSVNLSRAHLVSSDLSFLERFREMKEIYGIPDDMIELELTESLMLERREVDLAITMIDRMREMGFLCSIDDFGFGQSSLTMLKDLNVSTVKLDRQFFVGENEKTWKVVRQLIRLAHDLEMTVVAEGIEDREQVEKLWDYGCDMIQGYVFARPMPAEEFCEWSIKE